MNTYEYVVYTDGACIGNPGPGGWAAIVTDREGHEQILRGNAIQTTNNRMELRAALEALRTLPQGVRVLLRTDSRHLADAIAKGWAQRWRAQGWKRNKRDRAENVDLWAPLLDELERRDVTVEWVQAHNGDPLNERCDTIARTEAEHATDPDPGYPAIGERVPLLPYPQESTEITCQERADGSIALSDGKTTLVLPRTAVPEVVYQLAAALLRSCGGR